MTRGRGVVCLVGPDGERARRALALELAAGARRRDRLGRLAAGLSRPRHRHREADAGGARAGAAPLPRPRRSRRAVRRRPLSARRRTPRSTTSRARGRHALVVGGTGLYLRVLLRGLCPAPPRVPAAARGAARAGRAARPPTSCTAASRALDPAGRGAHPPARRGARRARARGGVRDRPAAVRLAGGAPLRRVAVRRARGRPRGRHRRTLDARIAARARRDGRRRIRSTRCARLRGARLCRRRRRRGRSVGYREMRARVDGALRPRGGVAAHRAGDAPVREAAAHLVPRTSRASCGAIARDARAAAGGSMAFLAHGSVRRRALRCARALQNREPHGRASTALSHASPGLDCRDPPSDRPHRRPAAPAAQPARAPGARGRPRRRSARRRGDLRAGARERRPRAAWRGRTAGRSPPAHVRAIFREIISASRGLEQRLRVAYLGPEATFTHLAARAAVRRRRRTTCRRRPIADVFDEVERGRAELGVVPVENSTEGVVAHTLDLLVESPLAICAEVMLRVAPLPARAARHDARGDPPRRLASAGAGAVPAVAGGAPAGRARPSRRRATRARPSAPPTSAARRRSPAEAAATATASHVLAARHPGRDRQRDALPRARPRRTRAADRRRQDLDRGARVRDEVGVLARLLRPFATHGIDLHQDRVAAAARAAVGVRLLPRPARASRASRAWRARWRRCERRALRAEGARLVSGRAAARSRDAPSTSATSSPSGSSTLDAVSARASRSRSSSASSASAARSSSRRTRTRSGRRRARSRRSPRAADAAPLSRRLGFYLRRALAERHGVVAGRDPRRQRLERDHRAGGAHLPAPARRGGDGRPGLRHLPHGRAGGGGDAARWCRCATSRTTSRRWPRR